jgi:hypothetical protein
LIAFKHHIREEKFEAILEFEFFRVISGRLLLLEGLFIDSHVALFN